MRKKTTSQLSLLLNIILILFFVIYFFVPFSATGFWSKAFSPLCTVVSAFQGEDFLPGWCLLHKDTDGQANEIDGEINAKINNNLNTNASLANPAAVKCKEDGGSSEPYSTTGGEASLCVFSDKSICEEWAYFRGECKKGDCQKVCKAINTKNEGWYNSCTGDLIKIEICSTSDENVNANDNSNTNVNVPLTNTNINATKPEPTSSSSITLISPVADEQLTSPVTVSGRAKTPDKIVYVRVKSKAGQEVINVTGSVKNIQADGFGDFSLKFTYEFSTTKEGFIEVFGKDGETEVGLVSIPVKF